MSAPNNKEPLNLLSLDGGGVRGVSELVILDRIMRRLQKKKGLDELPKPCDYFDLIAGTSTGGLIAILLGRLRMTTTEALETYDKVAGVIFCNSNKKTGIASKFKASTLKSVVEKIVAQCNDGDLMKNPQRPSQRGKAFVCAALADKLDDVHRFRTYDTEDESDRSLKGCKIWEAARATTAAPVYFKGIELGSGPARKTYVDAALGCNNPSEELLDEAGRVFHRRRKIGAIVSLGTGTRPNALVSPEDFGYLPSVAKAMKNITTSPEKPHQKLKRQFEDFPSTYFRFSVPNGAEKVGLAEWEKMGELKDLTTQYLDQAAVNQDIDDIVDVLARKKTAGLTLGHVARLDTDQLLMDTRKARHMGTASKNFVGRRDILDKLGACFSPRDTRHKLRRQFLLCGMGGAGKTQIALKFAETAGERFEYIFWVDAENLATATQSFKDIAVINMPEGSNQDLQMKDVQDWIASLKGEWLLILDNSDTESLNEIVPPGNSGNIIYTSRHRGLGLSLPRDSIAVVEDLGLEDSITLLLDAAEKVTYSEELRTEGKAIANELGCLALALDQAGSYIGQMGCSLSYYLELFRDRREILLKNEHFKGADPRNQTVYATFDISYEAVRELAHDQEGSVEGDDARAALDILNLICFYHNENIPAEMFERAAVQHHKIHGRNARFFGPDGTPVKGTFRALLKVDRQGAWNSMPFRYGVNLLEHFSLVNLDGGRQHFSIHILVHSWARDRMSDDQRVKCGLAAANILCSSSPYDRFPDIYQIFFQRQIFPHFQALQRILRISPHLKALKTNLDAEYMQNRLKLGLGPISQEAEDTSQSEQDTEYKYNESNMQSGFDVELAFIAQEAGDVTTAEHLYKRAVDAIKWPALDEEETLAVTLVLARLYETQGRFAEAEELQLEVLERGERSLGKTANLTILAMYDLVENYQDQTRLEAAEMMWRKIIQRKGQLLGTDDLKHPHLARDWAGLERLCSVGRRFGSQVERKQKELDAKIREHGPFHPATMASKMSLALELASERPDCWDQAEDLMVECGEDYTVLYGVEHKETMAARVAHAQICDMLQRSIEAETFLRSLLADHQRLFGPQDLATIDCLYHLGNAILRQGRYDEGLLLLERAVDLREVKFGTDHLLVAEARRSNKWLLDHARTTGPEERRRLGRRALDIWEQRPHTDEDVDDWTSRKHWYRNPVDHPNLQPELLYLTTEEINRPNRFPNHFEKQVENKLHLEVGLAGSASDTGNRTADEFI